MSINNSLEEVLMKTVNVLEESKKDIFTIGETARKEYDNIRIELDLIKEDINEVIDEVDTLEKKNRQARLRLMEVSRDFYNYTEKDIKAAYREAEESSIEIAVLREKEDQLRSRRQELENRLINLENTVIKAENLVSRVSIIRDFLKGELTNLSDEFDDLRQKHNLAIKIIQTQEEERRRLAREIHDGPAQSIANLVFRVELTEKLIDKDIQKAKNELEELKRLIRLSMQDVRKIIYNLRPMSLDDLGLIPTLKRYISKFTRETGIMIEFEVLGSQHRLSNTYEVTIFRLIQEALNNIFKHAMASNGKVRLEYGEDSINLLISDDGIGFKCSDIDEDKYGLISMEERCSLLGGNINIKSTHNKGTIIKILLPIKRSDELNDNSSISS
ncbi:MAG: sensor histidine kinase [Halanaerobiales bacterium]